MMFKGHVGRAAVVMLQQRRQGKSQRRLIKWDWISCQATAIYLSEIRKYVIYCRMLIRVAQERLKILVLQTTLMNLAQEECSRVLFLPVNSNTNSNK